MSLDMGQWLSIPLVLMGVVLVVLSYRGVLKEGTFTAKSTTGNNKKK
jgi:prolipoprotein diacylglyceryltransferase